MADVSDTDTRPTADGLPPDDATDQGSLAQLLAVLDLAPIPQDGEDVYLGQSQPQPWGRVYGGQVLGQAVVAAQHTVDAGRPVHSMHAYFLRAGDPAAPITFSVERLRDGHSFSARRVHALQHGRPILSMIASFQSPATGLDHQTPMPDGVPAPQTLPTMQERFGHLDGEAARRWLRRRPIDLRHVDPPVLLRQVKAGDHSPATPRTPGTSGTASTPSTPMWVWMRATGPIPDDPALHAAVLAYASDYCMLEPVLRPHAHSLADEGMRIASLDHAMWWHRAARVDEWLLFVLDSPSAQGARGLGTARVYTEDGTLVATVAQEGMVRLPREQNPG